MTTAAGKARISVEKPGRHEESLSLGRKASAIRLKESALRIVDTSCEKGVEASESLVTCIAFTED